ncbi:protein FAR1-RELATED SEQUENCE 11-like [Lycium ferocissimum]|uniref:protein FAR1-RELATED SEQUENCE 11-like n=1 Tax=Lycium ferocissimum TaxID=112874 RepID=UPI002814D796|nr:protein FAR1-RELATED SEQUENCE 11-like [Lycium ferocissimum]
MSLIRKVLELEKGVDPGQLPFTEKDIRNFVQSESSTNIESDALELLKMCKNLKDKDDDFQYDFTVDACQRLEHIIWAFGDSIRAYEIFGDVVVFYTTYRLNRYEMPLGIWIGADNHGNSIFFGCVLLRNEKASSFSWALKLYEWKASTNYANNSSFMANVYSPRS